MSTKCTICDLDEATRQGLEDLLRKGKDLQSCQRYLDGLGVKATLPGIRKHAKMHLEGYEEVDNLEPPSDTDDPPYIPFMLDVEGLRDELNLTGISDVKTAHDFLHHASNALIELWAAQAVIVYGAQKNFMSGEGKSPDQEVRTLQSITGMIEDLSKINVKILNQHISIEARDRMNDKVEEIKPAPTKNKAQRNRSEDDDT